MLAPVEIDLGLLLERLETPDKRKRTEVISDATAITSQVETEVLTNRLSPSQLQLPLSAPL